MPSYSGQWLNPQTLDIFTPLTGRMGRDAPAEHIIATLSAILTMVFMPFPAILFHRLSVKSQRKALGWLVVLVLGVVGVMNTPAWVVRVYDDMHPKRLGVHLQYNVCPLSFLAHPAAPLPDPTARRRSLWIVKLTTATCRMIQARPPCLFARQSAHMIDDFPNTYSAPRLHGPRPTPAHHTRNPPALWHAACPAGAVPHGETRSAVGLCIPRLGLYGHL